MEFWLLVKYDFQALSGRFLVNTTSADFIYDLKMKGEMTINETTRGRLPEIFLGIDDRDGAIEELSEDKRVVDLALSGGQTLLVRLPGTSRIFYFHWLRSHRDHSCYVE